MKCQSSYYPSSTMYLHQNGLYSCNNDPYSQGYPAYHAWCNETQNSPTGAVGAIGSVGPIGQIGVQGMGISPAQLAIPMGSVGGLGLPVAQVRAPLFGTQAQYPFTQANPFPYQYPYSAMQQSVYPYLNQTLVQSQPTPLPAVQAPILGHPILPGQLDLPHAAPFHVAVPPGATVHLQAPHIQVPHVQVPHVQVPHVQVRH